jgi:hypothetical protein
MHANRFGSCSGAYGIGSKYLIQSSFFHDFSQSLGTGNAFRTQSIRRLRQSIRMPDKEKMRPAFLIPMRNARRLSIGEMKLAGFYADHFTGITATKAKAGQKE